MAAPNLLCRACVSREVVCRNSSAMKAATLSAVYIGGAVLFVVLLVLFSCGLSDLGVSTVLDLSTAQPEDTGVPLYAIADLHGDLPQALRALRLAGLADASSSWAGGDAILVQLGDLLDRGPDSLGLVNLFERLKVEAQAVGGEVHTLLGNHEVINLKGRYEYVSKEELRKLGAKDHSGGRVPSAELIQEGRSRWAELMTLRAGVGQALRTWPLALLQGSGPCRTLLVHAGLQPGLLTELEAQQAGHPLTPEELLETLNSMIRGALRSSKPAASLEMLLDGPTSPTWLRTYATSTESMFCPHVTAVLDRLGAEQMVVGHNNVGPKAKVMCGRRLYMIDVGISSSLGGNMAIFKCHGGRPQVLYK